MASSASFIIEPYLKATTVRSPLGFMSLATYWAQLLFPGITVLTRDFLHVELLLRELRCHKRATEPREKILSALRSATLHARLEREYRRHVGDNQNQAITKVTYWQRYASMFDYFGLWNAPRALSREDLRRIVFSAHTPSEFQAWTPREDVVARQRRIRNTLWYSNFQDQLREAGGPARVLWWVTGEGGSADVRDEIKLSRRLSFAFLIWQTLFEAGIALTFQGVELPGASKRRLSSRAIVDLLVRATQQEPSKSDLRALFSGLLAAHSQHLGPSMSGWQKNVERRWSASTLTRLYDGTQVQDLARVPASRLFRRLVALHQHYCQAQGKADAEFIRFTKAGFQSLQLRGISASFNTTPGGLFGYRLDQAVALYRSA